MIHEVRGVVALSKGAPVTVETVLVPDPGPGEALVAVQACGVCRTDLHYRKAGSTTSSPSSWVTRPPGWWKPSMTLSDGTALAPALGIGAFVEKSLVMAGLGAAVNWRSWSVPSGSPVRPPETKRQVSMPLPAALRGPSPGAPRLRVRPLETARSPETR